MKYWLAGLCLLLARPVWPQIVTGSITRSGTRDFHGLGSYFKRHEQFNQ